MTNETTASQPKSIGDDAQFFALIDQWRHAALCARNDAYAELVSYIDNFRAPAAQASATIQAEPEGWTVEFDKYTLPGTIRLSSPKWGGCFLGKPTSSDTVLSALMYRYFADLLAATTQEPVMVAEPVELVGIAEQIKEGAGFWHSCSGCYDTEDGHPTGPYAYSNAMRCALGSGCAECGGLGARWDNNDYSEAAGDFLIAAPMVAEPAGVAPEVVYLRNMFGFWHVSTKDTEGAIAFSAATVKAVPSEALDEAPIECWSADQEDFNATSLDEVLTGREELKPGDTVWVGEAVRPNPKQLIDADDIMTMMGERAYDIAGEHADDYPDVSKEAEQELDELLAGWIGKHAKPNFWTVANVKPYVLSADDFTAPLAGKTGGAQ